MRRLFRYMRAQYWARHAGTMAVRGYIADINETKPDAYCAFRADVIYNEAYMKELKARYNG